MSLGKTCLSLFGWDADATNQTFGSLQPMSSLGTSNRTAGAVLVGAGGSRPVAGSLGRVYNWCRQNNPDSVLACVFPVEDVTPTPTPDGKGFFSVVEGTASVSVGCETDSGYFCVQSAHDKSIYKSVVSTLHNNCNYQIITHGEKNFVMFSCNTQGNETGHIVSVNIYDSDNNNIHSLDFSSLKKLTYIECQENVFLTTLTLPSSLTNLEIYGNTGLAPNLSSILSNLTNLQVLNCNSMNLTTLDVSGLTNLKQLYCSDNPGLITLDMSNCTSLTNLSSIIDSLSTTINGTLFITGVPGSDNPTLIQQAEHKGWTVIL